MTFEEMTAQVEEEGKRFLIDIMVMLKITDVELMQKIAARTAILQINTMELTRDMTTKRIASIMAKSNIEGKGGLQ